MGKINIESAIIDSETYGIEELTRFLGVSPQTIRRWEKSKEIPPAHRAKKCDEDAGTRFWTGHEVKWIYGYFKNTFYKRRKKLQEITAPASFGGMEIPRV